jgi:hypothetical protein
LSPWFVEPRFFALASLRSNQFSDMLLSFPVMKKGPVAP